MDCDLCTATTVALGVLLLALVGGALYAVQATNLPPEDGKKIDGRRALTIPASWNPHPLLFVLRGVICCKVRGGFRRSEKIPGLPDVVLRKEIKLAPKDYELFHRHFEPADSLDTGESRTTTGDKAPGKLPLFITYPNVAGEVMGIASLAHPENPLPAIPFPIHIRQRIELYRDVFVSAEEGCSFTVQARPDRLVPVDNGLELYIEFDALHDGKLFCRSTLIGLYKYAGKRPLAKSSTDAKVTEVELPADLQALERRDGRLGPENKEKWEVPASEGRKYAALSGDYNPIHLSPLMAKLIGGFKGAIIHGKWTLAKACAGLRRRGYLRPSSGKGVFVECSFRSPLVMPGKADFGCWGAVASDPMGVETRSGDVAEVEFAVWGKPRMRRELGAEYDDVFCFGTAGSCPVPK
jgi:acyl dehydratase